MNRKLHQDDAAWSIFAPARTKKALGVA